MKNYLRLAMAFTLLVSAGLSACNLPSIDIPNVTVVMDIPHSNGIYPLAGLFLGGHASFPAGSSVSSFNFYANGLGAGDVPPSTDGEPEGNAIAGTYWTPPEAGEYEIQIGVTLDTGKLTISDPVHICVLDIAFTSIEGYTILPYGYTDPCQIPPYLRHSTPPASSLVAITESSASPDSLAFSSIPECPSVVPLPEISFEAVLSDPADLVAFVIVDYVASVAAEHEDLTLSHTSSLPSGEKVFTGTTHDLSSWLQTDLFDTSGASVAIDWTAYAYSRDGSILATDGPYNILAAPCTPLVAPAPLPLIIAPTDTATVEANACPPGTYYAPNVNQCIQIEKPTKKSNSDDNGGSACSSYTDPSGCTTHACSWDKLTSTCH